MEQEKKLFTFPEDDEYEYDALEQEKQFEVEQYEDYPNPEKDH